MNYKIRLAKPSDLKNYIDLLQITYEFSYTNPKVGLTKDCFSPKIFNTKKAQKNFKTSLVNSSIQKTWLASSGSKLIGSATCKIIDQNNAGFSGFYIHPEFQHHGIGKKLYQKVLQFSKDKNLLLDTHLDNAKTIKIYKKWGWKVDTFRGDKGYFYCHWSEWPDDLQIKCVYLILKRK
jgi:RimJ/RimL family protein N-acetyltransferase